MTRSFNWGKFRSGIKRNLTHILMPSFFIFVTVQIIPELNMLQIFGTFTIVLILRSTYSARWWSNEFLLGYAAGSLILLGTFNLAAWYIGFDPKAITSVAVLGGFGVLLRRRGTFRWIRDYYYRTIRDSFTESTKDAVDSIKDSASEKTEGTLNSEPAQQDRIKWK